MCFIIKMYVLAYLLSLSASLDTGLNVLKSLNATVPSLSVDSNPTSQRNTTYHFVNGADDTRRDVSKSTYLEKLPREGRLQQRLRKIQNLHSDRRRNRTRKQKGITNTTLSHSVEKIKDNSKTVTHSTLYDSKIVQLYDVSSNTYKDTNEPNGTESTLPNTLPNNQTRITARSFNVTRPTSWAATQTTESPVRRETQSVKASNDKAESEGRSKNRPQRNRRKNPSVPRRHRHRISTVSQHESKDRKHNSKGSKSIESLPDLARVDKASGGDIKETLLNKDRGPTKKDCPTCGKNGLSEEKVRQIRLDMFIKTMADKLRVTPEELMARPRNRRVPRFPRELLEETLQDNAMQIHSEHFYAKDQKVILPGRDLGRNCIAKRTSGCYSFNLAGNIKGDVASAELWVYKTPDRNDSSIQTFLMYGLERLRSGKVLARNQIQRHDSDAKEGWVVINITRTITSWVQERKSREMIAIRCATCVTRNHKALYGTKHGYTPLIMIKYDKTSLQYRDRRSEDDCDPEFDCCKRNLEVDFREIHMHSVVAPPKLSVGYCYGACNGIHHYTHNHTLIKQKIRIESDDTTEEMRERLKPCCVPISLKDAMIMMASSRAGTVVTMPNAIVDQCGCV